MKNRRRARGLIEKALSVRNKPVGVGIQRGTRRRTVGRPKQIETGSFGAIVGKRQNQITTQLLLHVKVPLLYVTDAQMTIYRITIEDRELRVAGKSVRQSQNPVRGVDQVVAYRKGRLAGQLAVEGVINGSIVKDS